jgi:predicted phosphodiesterase
MTTNGNSIAVLSDIHGNRWALEAVMEDIGRRGISTVVNLGDCVYGPLDPAGTADILIDLNMPAVRGNEDRIITEAALSSPTLDYVREQLIRSHIEFLQSLQPAGSIDGEILLFHGTPDDDEEYLFHSVGPDGLRLRTNPEIRRRIDERPERLYLCGHDHLPNVVRWKDGKLVVNPGSVGLPAYSDDIPYRHLVENGSPHARYCIVGKPGSDWEVEPIAVPYDYESASDMARRNRREDWAHWLRTGRAN